MEAQHGSPFVHMQLISIAVEL